MVVLGWILIVIGLFFGISTVKAGPIGTFRRRRQMAPVSLRDKIIGYRLAIVLILAGLNAIGSTMS